MAQLEKLDRGEISVAQAREASNLAARMNTAVKTEHDRVRVRIEAEAHHKNGGSKIELRNLEGKNFE